MDENTFDYDLDGDGINDSFAMEYDTDADGVADVIGIDMDEDGDIDLYMYDTDQDGIMDTMLTDTDQDGIMDTILTDTNQDGIMDTILTDTNQDGIMDTILTDTNQDGIMDTMLTDTDYDGKFDTIHEDMDGDGIFEKEVQDTDGDGQSDTFMQVKYEDTDGDGEIDTIIVSSYDESEDYFELLEIKDLTNSEDEINKQELIEIEPIFDDGAENGVKYANLEHFDAQKTDSDYIVGNPEISMETWENQNYSGPCALYAQKFIIEEFTGQEVDINEMIDVAEENYWYQDGTSCMYIHKMLEYYGLECENTYGGTFQDIAECLNNGGRVIVAVDAEEFWYGEHDDGANVWSNEDEVVYTPTDTANHAVEVIGIDYSNPEEPMVILNDSGSENGCGIMVPYSAFMDAWEDSSNQIVTCYPAE